MFKWLSVDLLIEHGKEFAIILLCGCVGYLFLDGQKKDVALRDCDKARIADYVNFKNEVIGIVYKNKDVIDSAKTELNKINKKVNTGKK